jgi:plastocyanin
MALTLWHNTTFPSFALYFTALKTKKERNCKMNYTKWLLSISMFAGATQALAQENPHQAPWPPVAQIVALDECDPKTFNDPNPPAPGPGFCKNVALGATTPLLELFGKAQSGTPDPNWDFEPDILKIKEGTTVRVVDQGGEPHTFTEVAHFGGGFVPMLNGPGEETVPECSGGFSSVAVARTRLLQGSQSEIIGLSKGEHLFQCCIHPWMRVKVEVSDHAHEHDHGSSEK